MAQPQPKQPERRQYKRIQKYFIVRYYEMDAPDVKYDATQLKNISIGGLCIVTPKSFPLSCKLGLDLKTPFQAEMTHLEGVVLESHERVRGVIYETRLKFTNISPPSEFVLKKMIEHFEKEEGSKHE